MVSPKMLELLEKWDASLRSTMYWGKPYYDVNEQLLLEAPDSTGDLLPWRYVAQLHDLFGLGVEKPGIRSAACLHAVVQFLKWAQGR